MFDSCLPSLETTGLITFSGETSADLVIPFLSAGVHELNLAACETGFL